MGRQVLTYPVRPSVQEEIKSGIGADVLAQAGAEEGKHDEADGFISQLVWGHNLRITRIEIDEIRVRRFAAAMKESERHISRKGV